MNLHEVPVIPNLTSEQLNEIPVEKLRPLFLSCLQAMQLATQNTHDLMELLRQAHAAIEEQKNALASQEAELLVLRNKP